MKACGPTAESRFIKIKFGHELMITILAIPTPYLDLIRGIQIIDQGSRRKGKKKVQVNFILIMTKPNNKTSKQHPTRWIAK